MAGGERKMRRAGFSLLELSVVLTILAVVVAGGLTLSSAKVQQDKLGNTYDEMKEIAQAISIYVNEHGCMPYPAAGTAVPGGATYGREPAANAECATTGGTGSAVLAGTVPFYSLGLPDEYGSDEWGYRYTYAVTDTAVEAITSSYTGAITVNDTGGNAITTEGAFVLVSHGKTHEGARAAKTGTVAVACGSTTKDSENCDADATFVDADYNDGSVAASFFDDIIIWKNTSGIYEYGASGSSSSGGGEGAPTDVTKTTATTTGSVGGYSGLKTLVEGDCGSGYRICTGDDLIKYVRSTGTSWSALSTTLGTAWVVHSVDNGTVDAIQDCYGWTDGTGTPKSGYLYYSAGLATTIAFQACNSTRTVSCCKW